MNQFNATYYESGKGFCGLFVVDDFGQLMPVGPDNLCQLVAYVTNEWQVVFNA